MDFAGSIKVNGEEVIYPYSMEQFRLDNPDVLMRNDPPAEVLAEWGVYPVHATESPAPGFAKYVTGDVPILVDGQWMQTWKEIPAPVPKSVSMAQARIALSRAGLLSQVEAAIQAIPDETARSEAEIFWKYATEVQRTNSLIQSLGPVMGMTEEQIDNLFHVAKTIN